MHFICRTFLFLANSGSFTTDEVVLIGYSYLKTSFNVPWKLFLKKKKKKKKKKKIIVRYGPFFLSTSRKMHFVRIDHTFIEKMFREMHFVRIIFSENITCRATRFRSFINKKCHISYIFKFRCNVNGINNMLRM